MIAGPTTIMECYVFPYFLSVCPVFCSFKFLTDEIRRVDGSVQNVIVHDFGNKSFMCVITVSLSFRENTYCVIYVRSVTLRPIYSTGWAIKNRPPTCQLIMSSKSNVHLK